MTRPGLLTVDFFEGRRKPYVAPLQLFLIINLLFFVLQPFVGWNTFTTPLQTHLTASLHADLARKVVRRELAERQVTLPDFAREFDAAAEVHAKSLVIVMVPLFALLVAAAYITTRRYFVHHLVFSLHFYALLLLFEVVGFAVVGILVDLLTAAGVAVNEWTVDQVFTSVSVVLLGAYLFVALRRFYGERTVPTLLKAAGLSIGIGVVLMAYRFILFFVTIATI